MQAIILAAGMGKRLGEYTKSNTKCMVPVNGVPLIDRLLAQLGKLSLNRVVIVIGYEGEKLQNHIGSRYANLNIEYVNNPIYDKTNNIYSLSLAKSQMQEDDTLLIESDLIYDDGIFELLTNNPYPNLALVAKYEPWMDGTMVRIDDECYITNFIPKVDFKYSEVDSYYKTVNIYKFSKEFSATKYVPFLDAYTKSVGTNEYYENVLRIISFLNSHDLKALPISSEKWYEIDDKQDLDIAEVLFAEDDTLLSKFYSRYGGYWRFPKVLDYCYLVNPFFPNDRFLEELQSNFRTLLTQYPSGMKVNTLLASKCWGVCEDFIVPGNGAAELIKILMQKLTGKIGCVRPTFEEYPNRYLPQELVVYTSQHPDYQYNASDLISYFDNKDIRALLLINPDNPSGNFISKKDVLILAEWCKEKSIRFVLDESFIDFSVEWRHNSMLSDELLIQYPNLVIIKSISKSFGVPGLRLGILASSDTELISHIKREVSIWNLNSFAEYFMQIYSKYEKDYQRACDKFLIEREDFENQLRTISYLRIIPSQANYFLVEVLPPCSVRTLVIGLLRDHNILTRDCSNKQGLDGKQYMRIAVRGHGDNAKLIAALRTYI